MHESELIIDNIIIILCFIGYESPVWDTKEETNSNYYYLVELVLNRVKNTTQDSTVVGSHNEDTILLVMDK